MDIKGVEPVANRIKQRPFEAKIKTHFDGHTASLPINGARSAGPAVRSAGPAHTVATALEPAPAALAAAFDSRVSSLPQTKNKERPLKPARRRRNRLTRRGMVFRGAAVSFVLVATVGSLLAWNGYVKLHKVFHGPSVVAALAPKLAESQTLNGANSGRINILLLGVSGSGGTGADLTDTVALLSIDPVNDKAVILNIPTDLWVQRPLSYYGHQELNGVYKSGRDSALGPSSRSTDPGVMQAGFDSLDQVVEQVTGVNIDYHLLINFQAFKQAVDTVGGITIDSPGRLYDPSLGWRNHVSPVLATAGAQHMDGNQALLYVRSRIDTGKSTQVQRELQVLGALKEKVLSAGTFSNPAKLEGLIEGFGNNAYSDLSIKGAGQLYSLMGKIGDTNISSVSLTGSSLNLFTTRHIGGLAVAEPSAGLNSYADIQQYIRGYTASGHIANEDAPVAVASGTAAGAVIAGNMLKSYGCNVAATETTKQRVSDLTLVDLSGGDDPYTLHFLENHYGVKAMTEVPAGVGIAPGSAKFVIIEP